MDENWGVSPMDWKPPYLVISSMILHGNRTSTSMEVYTLENQLYMGNCPLVWWWSGTIPIILMIVAIGCYYFLTGKNWWNDQNWDLRMIGSRSSSSSPSLSPSSSSSSQHISIIIIKINTTYINHIIIVYRYIIILKWIESVVSKDKTIQLNVNNKE